MLARAADSQAGSQGPGLFPTQTFHQSVAILILLCWLVSAVRLFSQVLMVGPHQGTLLHSKHMQNSGTSCFGVSG